MRTFRLRTAGIALLALSAVAFAAMAAVVPASSRTPAPKIKVLSNRADLISGGDALPSDVVVLECATSEGPRELAMDRSTVTGFLSWVESAPPVR